MQAYPAVESQQTKWIRNLRGERNPVSPASGCAALHETESLGDGQFVNANVVFPVNSECPFTCVMCDLWKNTLAGPTPGGFVVRQIAKALAALPRAQWIKIYNAGSFFDFHAIPLADYRAIAELLQDYERVIVECHPAFVDERVLAFRDLLPGRLEVAMGLETVHETTLKLLNKRCNLTQLESAARWLGEHSIDLRLFVIVRPPFQQENEALTWGLRSLEFANDLNACATILIPARAGNGAMEELQKRDLFTPPHIKTVEYLLQAGLEMNKSRVYVDTWSPSWRLTCSCDEARVVRIQEMNSCQAITPAISCDVCNSSLEYI